MLFIFPFYFLGCSLVRLDGCRNDVVMMFWNTNIEIERDENVVTKENYIHHKHESEKTNGKTGVRVYGRDEMVCS